MELNEFIKKLRKMTVYIGPSKKSRKLAEKIMFAVNDPQEKPVMLLGEAGVGKSRIARVIHLLSRRGKEDNKLDRFRAKNLAGLDKIAFHSELFGHVQGSYTGAFFHRTGLFEGANMGTVFLDEITTIDIASQALLLDILGFDHQRRYTKVQFKKYGACLGDLSTIPEKDKEHHEERESNVRIICATNDKFEYNYPDLSFPSGNIRDDLVSRLEGHVIIIPSVKERVEDLDHFVEAILKDISSSLGKPITILDEARDKLKEFDFKYNFRSLIKILTDSAVYHLKNREKTIEIAEIYIN